MRRRQAVRHTIYKARERQRGRDINSQKSKNNDEDRENIAYMQKRQKQTATTWNYGESSNLKETEDRKKYGVPSIRWKREIRQVK